jgi:Icc-related predicted phosphoesterase
VTRTNGDRPAPDGSVLRVAAAGDVHCREANRDAVVESFARLRDKADLVLLAGDLTAHGTAAEAEILCEAADHLDAPICAVLGNHDWHGGEAEAIAARLEEAGIELLDRRAVILQVAGVEVGIVGAKGFVGGFAPRHLPDFGEPSLRAVYAETGAEAEAIDAGLREIATCPLRVVLLHYAPVAATLEGEPPEIHVFLGSERLAVPIREHGPDLVLHGHAHEGAPDGWIGETPVHNVSQPVLARDFWLEELDASHAHSPIP